MPDRRQPSSTDDTDDNPFAAPPEGQPDQPWQPREGAHRYDRQGGGEGPGQGQGPGGGGPIRWDPTDPVQRRARYALLSGMWGFFFGLFGIPAMGLMLGALALYWGVSALRAKRDPAEAAGGAGRAGLGAGGGAAGAARREEGLAALGDAARPQRTAAASGLVMATLALLLAAGSYTVQLVYKDFYVCRDDALTQTAELECNKLLPDNLLGRLLEVKR
ncbi:hypothetical protein [Streptomyces antimicrobicus]|uniref:Integral membrane protein n=1 Tax=Streptomyces antimicrobicus TaxID=2883108 RepID=A0ABS8BG63_9ACTN|nr:hypothetical protein [Streptomyces antimicrobicus]MCB5183534.1 hypothetical protein [Streptomyces antimicrobicus]